MRELAIQHISATESEPQRVRVSYRPELGAQVQESVAEFDFTLTEEQHKLIQWYLEEYLFFPWGEFQNRATKAEDLMSELGVGLFESVFCNQEVDRLYSHIADNLSDSRIVIHADDPTGISLPWELMRDPNLGNNGDLALLAQNFVRSQPDLSPVPIQIPEFDTFNILIVICRPGGPEGDVPFQTVAKPLLELFRPHRKRIVLDVLRPPTFENLSQTLLENPNYYHVLHFDGHGAFPQKEAGDEYWFMGQGYLVFEGEKGRRQEIPGKKLGKLLATHRVPVVLLNACQSGMTHPESVFPSIGNELLKAGASGVVAMTYSVLVQTAVHYMARLYEGLINGDELAKAAANAREELWTHSQRSSPIGEIELRDWVVPVLFQAKPVRVMERTKPLQLDLNTLEDQQAEAGAEIDCPEPPAYGFVGRDSVMLELERAFQHETIVLLKGMAGIGKTETAIGFGRWRAETGGLDGPIFFFHFERYLPLTQVCDRVGQVINPIMSQEVGEEWHLLHPDQRRHVAVDILRQVPCLLIWDNFEPVVGFPVGSESSWKLEEQQALRDFLRELRGGQTKVLLTSRRDENWLGDIYKTIELSGLKLPEAQEMALRVLRRTGLTSREIRTIPQYNDLLRYLKGNPLAIQVILPELKRTKPDELLDELKSGKTHLRKDDPAQGREKSLSASLSYRLDSLNLTLRQRLGLLGLFQGFVNVGVFASLSKSEGAPELIGGLGRDEWVEILDSAAEVGLLRDLEDGYYSIHPALPWFFHDLLDEAFINHREWLEKTIVTIYGDYSIELYELFESNPGFAISLLSAEESNLIFTLQLARKQQLWQAILNLPYGLYRLYDVQGRWVEWERIVDELETVSVDNNGEPIHGKEGLWLALLGHRSSISERMRDFETAEAINLQIKEYCETSGDEANQAASLQKLGIIAEERRNFDEAEGWYRQSLDLNMRIGNEIGRAGALHQLGRIAEKRRRFGEAEDWYRQSLEINKRIGDEQGQAYAIHNLGTIAREQGQYAEAERCFYQSLEILEAIGEYSTLSETFHALGLLAQERRRFGEAEDWYRQALEIEEHIGDEQRQVSTLFHLGRIAEEQGNLDEAERWYYQSLEYGERIGDEYGNANSLNQLGNVALERHEFDKAENLYNQSLEIKVRIGDEQGLAGTLHQLGIIAEERGNIRKAYGLYQRSESLFKKVNDPYHLEMVRQSLERIQPGFDNRE